VRKALWIVGLALGVAVAASAQNAPRAEVFGGYSYMWVRGYANTASLLDPNAASSQQSSVAFPSFGSNGWIGSVNISATRWLGVVAEVSGLYATPTKTIAGIPVTVGMREHHYLFGPRFSLRRGRWTPFAHALFGMAHTSLLIGGPGLSVPVSVVETTFATAVGGGVDVRAYRSVAVRLVQADWLTTRFVGSHQNNIRLSAGLVFRF
jgi:hypothetical protein